MADDTNPVPSGKIHHVPAPSRGMESQQNANSLRGGKPKGYPIAVAWGQHHVGEDGTRQTGISRTESAAALTGYKLPTDPAKQHGSKMVPVPGVTRGMKSDPERGHYDPGMAHRVVGEAVASGSTKLPSATSEE